MFLVNGLACDPKRLCHLGPRPARAHGPFDLGVLEPICNRPQCRRGREAVGRPAHGRRS